MFFWKKQHNYVTLRSKSIFLHEQLSNMLAVFSKYDANFDCRDYIWMTFPVVAKTKFTIEVDILSNFSHVV